MLFLCGRPALIVNVRAALAHGCGGSGARVFTIMQELDDKIVLASAISAFLQNAVLVSQILMLGAPKADAKSKKKAGSKSK